MRHTLTSTTCSGTIRRIDKDADKGYIQIDSCGFWLTPTMHELICQKFGLFPVGREIDVTYNVQTGYVTSIEEPIV